MPISVRCSCGKVFKVRDEMAGKDVTCQVCRGIVKVPAEPSYAPPSEDVPLPAAEMPPAPAPPGAGVSRLKLPDMMQCPACAEAIPLSSMFCPICGEQLPTLVSTEQKKEHLAKVLATLDEYVANSDNLAADRKMRGSTFSPLGIVLAVLSVCLLSMIPMGLAVHDGEPLIILGAILGGLLAIISLVALGNDYIYSHISDAKTPVAAFKRYVGAIRSGRANKAFASLVPTARNARAPLTIRFEKIPPNPGTFPFNEPQSFRKYWRNILKGTGGQVRAMGVKRIRLLNETPGGVAFVEVEFGFTGHSAWWYLTLLINLIVGAIIILAVQKREKKVVRKLLVKRGGRWYVAEGEFEGLLDDPRILA